MDSTQFDILKTEFLLTQQQMDKYDQLSTTTKTWAVTLWAASIGWSFQVKRSEILLLSIVIVCAFWFFDGFNKTYRQGYKKRRDEVAKGLSDLFLGKQLPSGFLSPQLPTNEKANTMKNTFLLHIALPYLLLAFVSVILYLKF